MKGFRAVIAAGIMSGAVLSGCGVAIAIDACDPSENLELSEMTSEELDELCGEDRDFIMGQE